MTCYGPEYTRLKGGPGENEWGNKFVPIFDMWFASDDSFESIDYCVFDFLAVVLLAA
jgi:hypothetical protein